jgi:AbrB family looped-hinge helix DNA binding protein
MAHSSDKPRVAHQTKKLAWGQVSPSGRLSLPADFRKALGLERGGKVLVELAGDEIRLRTIRAAVERVQARAKQLFAGKPHVSSADFLAHRRQDWGEE